MAKISDIRNKTIYIYGAGYRGQYCYDIIKHTACVKAFLVSGNSCLENKGGVPVIPIDSYAEKLMNQKTDFIIIAVKEKTAQREIIDMLQKHNIDYYANVFCDANTVEEFWEEFVKLSPSIGEKQCPICNRTVKMFGPSGTPLRYNALCPHCNSLERHRALWLHVNKKKILPESNNIKLLHFAPENCFYNILQNRVADYYPVDYNPDFPGIRCRVDITNIPYKDDFFDVIICNHVLEHIIDEERALTEISRILKAEGTAIITVPLNGLDKTFEKPEYDTPELRLIHYGQEDHVRIYGRDIKKRLKMFFSVEMVDNSSFSDEELAKYGLIKNEVIFFCSKQKEQGGR